MKNSILTSRIALRLAASASLAAVVMVSSAHARQSPPVVPVSESVTLRTGNDNLGDPLFPGDDDSNINKFAVADCAPGSSILNEHFLASIGPPAKVVTPPVFWVPAISDPDARWIHSDPDPTVLAPNLGVQYAHSFDLPADMPPGALVSIDLEYAADNLVREVSFGDTNNPVPLIALPPGNFQTPTIQSRTGTASDFGLTAGPNLMFFRVCDTDERASGLIYSVTLTIDYCKIEVDPLRSGFGNFPEDAEVDVVFLCDTTGSMGTIITQIQADVNVILTNLQTNYTQDIRVGIASYKDFNTPLSLPSPLHSTYVYRLEAPLVDISTPFGDWAVRTGIALWTAGGGGGDGPEGQFYAFHRLSDDNEATVGWRQGSIRIIVYIGDSPAHDPICPVLHNGTGEVQALDEILCDSANPDCDGSFPLTEASVIAELQANGVWGGTKVIAVNCKQPNVNTNFIEGLNSPPDGDNGSNPPNGNGDYDSYTPECTQASLGGQADRISSQTGGSYIEVTDPTAVTQQIEDAFTAVLNGGTAYPCGWPEPNNVVHQPLSNSNAYTDISSSMGIPSLLVCREPSWIPTLPGGSAWIHSSHDPNAVGGTGRPPESVLHAHPFDLPSIPPGGAVFLDLEWAASDSLYGVSINADVLSPGGNVSIGGVPGWDTSNEYSFASNGTFSGPASSFNFVQGENRLYLSQYERAPDPNAGNDECSGIMYVAKLKITFPCEIPITYEIFCECIGDWAVCMNPGGPGEGCENSTGAGGALTASGTYTNTTLNADNLPLPGTIGLFFVGNSPIGPFHLGDGLRCVGGDPVRIGIVSSNTGHAHLPIGPSQPGELYQFWYRDNWGPCNTGFNLTNAIEIQ